VVTAVDEDTPIAFDVVPGQDNDAPLLEPMLDQTIDRVGTIDVLVGDKGFDGDAQRVACLDNGAVPNIPNRKNRTDPWPHDPEGYKDRNRVERLFGKLKQFRRVATRYEKLKATFMGMIRVAFSFIRLRRLQRDKNVNTP
jgi:transposase